MENYILNKETQKIELHFDKEDYINLSEELKKKLKSAYLFSGKAKAWVSRSKNNHYRAIQIAKDLGFKDKEIVGEKLSFAEEIENQKEKAERKIERYEKYASNAENRAKDLQSEFNNYRKDIAFLTQPIIRGHKGSEAFGNQRNRIMARYGKGFEEYRKSKYFTDKAENMESIINGDKFKDRVYLNNRIAECKKLIKVYEKNIIWCEENSSTDINHWLEQLEYIIDKLAYIENCLDAIGGIKYNAANLKIGYEIKIRGHWETILKLNKKTVESQPLEEHLKVCYGKREYAEIQEMRIPNNLKVEEVKNPFNIDDIVTANSMGGTRILYAYQVIKITKKCAVIKEIILDKNKIPVKDSFKGGAKESRRLIKRNSFDGRIYITDDNYALWKFNLN